MKHNKKELKYKDFIKAEKRLDQVYKLKRELPYREVAKPYQDGWFIIPTLREDFMRSDKGPIIKTLIDKYSKIDICRDPKKITELRRKSSLFDARTILHKNKAYYMDRPSISSISKREYDILGEQVKKYFSETSKYFWNRIGNEYKPRYELNIPSHYLVVKIEKRIVTHIRDIDPILLQEEAELRTILAPYWRTGSYDGNYHYFEKRAERRKSKVDIKKLIEEEI